MPVLEILLSAVAVPVSKMLLKRYLSDSVTPITDELLGIAKTRLTGILQQKDAARQFEALGEKIAASLEAVFTPYERNNDVNVEAVALAVGAALTDKISAEFCMTASLSGQMLYRRFRDESPIPSGFTISEEQLYLRALEDTASFLVGVADKLPGFQLALAKESLQKLERERPLIERILEELAQISRGLEQQEARARTKEERFEMQYRNAVVASQDYMELFGADVRPESQRHKLSVAYISLTIQSQKEGQTIEYVEDFLERLGTDTNRVLIKGVAGSGKSTLFRWIAIEAAKLSAFQRRQGKQDRKEIGFAEEPVMVPETHWSRKIPFLIKLRHCNGGQLPNPEDFPKHLVSGLRETPEDWVQSILDEGRAIILIDGVDEIAPHYRDTSFRQGLKNLLDLYRNNYFLVSSRPAGLPEGFLTDVGFTDTSLADLAAYDKEQLVVKWHEAVSEELRLVGRPDEALKTTGLALVRKLEELSNVSRLAVNPLLCAMLCALHRDRFRHLPSSQAELCEAICHLFLVRREQEGGLSASDFPEAFRKLEYEEKRHLVRDLAYYMVDNGEQVIGREIALNLTRRRISQFKNSKPEEAQTILDCLIIRCGMLRERNAENELEFVHNTLKEYLAAERFVEERGFGKLVQNHNDPTYRNIILFAAATRTENFASELVERLLEDKSKDTFWSKLLGKKPEDVARSRKIVALHCRQMATTLKQELLQKLDALDEFILPIETEEEAEALAAGGNRIIHRLAYREDYTDRQNACSLKTLSLIGTKESLGIIKSYIQAKSNDIIKILARVINPLEIPSIVRDIQSVNFQEQWYSKLIHDLAPLSGLTGLQRLGLDNTSVSDVSALSGLTGLQWLGLDNTSVSDVSALSGLMGLQGLGLDNTSVSDVSALSGLTGLQTLGLDNTSVSDVSALSGLTGLQGLGLNNTSVSDVSALSGLTGLQRLGLDNTSVSDVSALSGLTGLQWLDLDNTSVSDVSALSGLTGLQTLYLNNTSVSDVSALSGLTGLQGLGLNNTSVSDVSALSGLTGLQWLGLNNTSVSDVSALSGLTGLQTLYLHNTFVSKANIQKLKRQLPSCSIHS